MTRGSPKSCEDYLKYRYASTPTHNEPHSEYFQHQPMTAGHKCNSETHEDTYMKRLCASSTDGAILPQHFESTALNQYFPKEHFAEVKHSYLC